MCRKDFRGPQYVRRIHIDWPSADNVHQNEAAGLALLRKIVMEPSDEVSELSGEVQTWLDESQSDPVGASSVFYKFI